MNTRFNNQPKLELMKEDSGGRAYFKLLEDFTLNINEVTITVPKFFTTDFASVPRILWSIFPPVGNYSSAALIHDYLYTRKANCPRLLADAIFNCAMQALEVSWWRRNALYITVRIFGRFAFRGR